MTSSIAFEENSEVIRINMENFNSFLENKFNEKYEFSLESLKQRFVGIYTLLKLIFEKVIEIHDVLSEDMSEGNVFATYKPLLDNMIRLLDLMMKEFPECLDLEFVEFFFLSVQERIQIFLSHFHQIFHINHADPQIINKISKLTKIIDNAIVQIPQSVIEIQKRAELSVPLLKYIRDCKQMFRTPIKKIREEIQILSNNKSFEEYESIIEDLKNRTKSNFKFKIDLINKMVDLVKEASQYQFELNKLLKPYYAMANAIKLKGKKFLNENLKLNDQAKLTKFVNFLMRPDFVNSALFEIEVSEMIYIMNIMETQGSLVSEYKKTLIKGVEEYNPINTVEFEILVNKYKMVMLEINNFQEFAQNNFDYFRYNKETVNQIFKDIKRVVDKYKEFQNGIYHYQEILELFGKIRNLSSRFCFNEFGLKVELICEFNL